MIPSLLVIRSQKLAETVQFYQQLGFEFIEEQHGKGPIHYSCTMDQFVMELFPCKDGQVASNNRLGFELPSTHPHQQEILAHVETISRKAHPRGHGKMARIVTDPDRRKIEILFEVE